MKTFKIGGVHPKDYKLSADSPIAQMDLPDRAVIFVSQHIGSPSTPCVSKGDKVLVGDLIATASGFVSANIHSSVSGTITAIEPMIDGGGVKKIAIIIDRDGDEWNTSIDRSDDLIKNCTLDSKEIIAKIAAAGVVGLGGATFPTQVKMSPPADKTPEILIVNGVECEPYLTADYRLMIEKTEELLVACEIFMRALGVERCMIGVENNKPEAISRLTELGKNYKNIKIVPLKVKYPQGGEKQLIDALTGRKVPSGGLPIDIGVVVQNVGTMFAIYQAVQKNKPVIERVVTVTGSDIEKPSNLLVRIGTPISSLIKYCGGEPEQTGKVINGGPMMGRAVSNIDSPVTKGTSGVVLIPSKDAKRPITMNCILCAKCVGMCPMGLEPYLLAKVSKAQLWDRLEAEKITDCIECGCCTFTCPAGLPLLDYIRLGKAETIKIIRNRK